ncbi:MAG: DUF975 family protein [Clostridium sp.]|nr:DUF975 family protein [Clostridium sp.]
MNMTKSSAELKASAKAQLLGHYGKMIGAFLLMDCACAFILYLAEDLLSSPTLANQILYYVIELLVYLLLGVFMLGQARLYMNFVTGRPVSLNDLLYGFRSRSELGIRIMLIYIANILICLIPFAIALSVYVYVGLVHLLPLVSVLLVGGMIAACIRLLSLSQCYYIALDFPEYRFRQVCAMSRRVMKGQRARLFYLYVSFLPLALLCLCSFGLGLLWLYPYMQCTLTHFYFDLMDYHTRQYA